MSATTKNEKPIVHLRLYKGKTMAYDANGKVLNPNQLVKLKYNTLEWNNFLKMLPSMGFSSVKVEKVLDAKTEEEITDIPKEISEAVEKVFKKEESTQSSEEKTIESLKAQNKELEVKNKGFEERLKALEKGGGAKVETEDEKELRLAKEAYKAKFGKIVPPAQSKDLAWIKSKLSE